MYEAQRSKRRGFTIVEMILVVVIIAILATITIVVYTSVQKRSQQSAAMAEMQSNSQKLSAYALANGTRMPTYAQTQADSTIALTFKGGVYKQMTYCNGPTQAAFGALLKSGDVVYMQVGGTPTVDATFTASTVCTKLGITNSDGSAAPVTYIVGP